MSIEMAPTALGPRAGRTVMMAFGGIVVATLVAACFASAPASTVAAAQDTVSSTKLTTVAEFPAGSFLENVAIRADGSLLVTELKKKDLWYVPAPTAGTAVRPVLLHRFDQPPFDIVETERDVFYVDTSSYLTSHDSYLYRVDLRHWKLDMPVPVHRILKFPLRFSAVNGSCVLAPRVILVADSLLGLIWRVDLSADGTTGRARVWLKGPQHEP